MTRTARVGLLPLYLMLYDEKLPEMRKELDPFLDHIGQLLEQRGLSLVRAPVCRVRAEFAEAVRRFEAEDVDLIVTLHLAYSPSLEAVDVLAQSPLPVLFLDTTMDYAFGPDVGADRILYNHGIHGVQDLAAMLRRRGKPYHIVAGHWEHSDVLDRACGYAGAALAARELRETRALRVGCAFEGMGDFAVDEAVLREVFGIRVDRMEALELASEVAAVTEDDIDSELAADRKRFECRVPEAVHRRSLRVGLALRRRLEHGGYGAFSMNFQSFDRGDGPVDTVPFLEASKAMARGIGYAGEGDVLTASLVGALARAFGRTTFTEIFCPDWRGQSVFLSHMGEINPEVAAVQPLLYEKPYPFSDAQNPAALACAPAPGRAVLVNLAPGPDDTFRLIAASVDVLEDTENPELEQWIRGWIRPSGELGPFLETYSRLGGTHHSALVLGERCEAIAAFASFAGIECRIIE